MNTKQTGLVVSETTRPQSQTTNCRNNGLPQSTTNENSGQYLESLIKLYQCGDQRRITVATLRPESAPDRVAGVVYQVGTVALLSSVRTIAKMDASGSFHWDCGVIQNAINHYGVPLLEIIDKTSGKTYVTTTQILFEHGQVQTRWAGSKQWALHVRFYSIDGAMPAAFAQQSAPAPTAEQPALFEFAEPARRVY